MHRFMKQHADKITGVLSGFDRIVFRGTLRNLSFPEGVKSALDRQGVLLKQFGTFVQAVTKMLRDEVAMSARRLAIPTRHLASSHIRKEDVALGFLRDNPIRSGPICVLSAVEPCMTWQVFRSKANKTQELRWRSGKCLHHYHYFLYPEFGLMHVRVQTWMPYTVQICMNGREWLGRKLSPRYAGEITTDFKRRIEGIRVKHAAGSNSVKMYDKFGLLRVETTLNKPGDFKVRRRAQGDPKSEVKLRPLRKNVVDIGRRARIGQAANKRYLDALAVVDDDTPLDKLLLPLARPATIGKQRVRGLRPLTQDVALLAAVGRGEFVATGFRNRDVLAILFPHHADDCDARRRVSAKVTRLLRLLRAHGVIQKVEGTHRYVVTPSGAKAIAAILAATSASLSRLQQTA